MDHDNDHLYHCDDLVPYGICPLTGEADAYARRILCDLSEAGVTLLTAYLGLSHTTEARHAFPRQMNEKVGSQPAVAGVLLARALFPDLMVFALLHVGQYGYVLEAPDGSYTGFNEGDRYAQHYLREDGALPTGYRLHTNCAKRSRAPQVEGRNVHAMSGRFI